MKHSYCYRFIVGVWMCLFHVLCITALPATQIDRLYTPDMIAWRGVTTNLPICMDNPHDVTAVQFNIGIPCEMKIDRDAFQLTNRSVDHQIVTRLINTDGTKNWYQVMVFSPSNSLFAGRSGSIIDIKFTMGDEAVDGTQLTPAITDGVMSTVDRVNVLREATTGNISIVFGPDLVIPSINVSETSVSPGGELNISWTVSNNGDEPCEAGWKEEISIIDERASSENYSDFSTCYLGYVKYEDVLDGRSSVSRQASITLPKMVGLDGACRVMIRIVPFPGSNERPESRINNTTVGQQVIEVEKHLTLQLNTDSVEEGRTHTISAVLSRSGSWDDEEIFSVRSYGDDRVIVPSSVTIPKGQGAVRFDIHVTDNDALDALDAVATIEVSDASSVSPYAAVSTQLWVEDDEYPDLSVSASKSVVNEGETFQLTITTSRASAQPIVVTLMSENSKRFSFPSQVTIPAGETSVTVTVEAIDDETPSLNLSNAFTVSALRHNKAEAIVLLADNDLPVLEMTLTPTTVSESAGVVAVTGTLGRTTNIDSKVTVKLTDDADGGLYFGNRTIELAKGKEEISFNFGPVDNALVDGDRTYTITASVWLSSCNCGASGESAGYTTAQVQVLDNDGAALGLSSSVSTLKEGSSTTLTISRNTAADSPLTVSLNSDYDEGLSYPQSVTIPAGQKSTTVEVVSAVNDVQGDSHNVVFTVLANGYATGTCFITVTDQTKPDAAVSAIRADRYEMEVGETVGLSVVVANKGIAVLPAHMAVRIDCSGGSGNKTLYTPSDLAAGDSVVLVSDYQLPVTNTGTYTLTATVNPERSVSELNYNNNSLSMAAITVKPNFSATVTVDKQVYRQGETVVISGQTSAGGRNADVEVYLVNNGTRQSMTVKADGEGRFQTTYQPYNRQSGHFVAGACYPKTGETSGSAEFDVYGLLLSGAYATHDISLGDEAKGSFVIQNPGSLSQSGLQIEQLREPVGCKLTVRAVSSIAAGGQVEVSYTLKANAVTDGSDWLQVPLRITTTEGSTAEFTIYYYVRSLKGQLKADQTRIETTITKGVPREYQIQISNVGRGETGTISLSLPTWVRSLTPKQMPSLASGESTTVVLQLTTTEDMQMNVPVNGQIGINCEKGNGVPISLLMTPVSEDKGQLLIDVVDEYTYYAEGGPHVKDARVLVKHPTTGLVMAQGLTGANGRYQVELPEGWYTVSINADKHQGYETTLEIAPGKQTGKEIFLTYEAVSYSWEVVETEVEDEYEIETVVTYETNVPKPVVIITLPDEKPEVGGIVPVVVTNKGLINAIHADLSLSVSEGLTLEWLTDPTLAVLAPQQSVTFYAVLKEEAEAHSARRKAPGIIQTLVCLALKAKLETAYICGDVEKAMTIESSKAWGNCLAGGSGGSGSGGSGSGGGGIGGGSWTGGGGGTGGSHPGSSPGGSGNSSYNGSSSSGNVSRTDNLCHEKDLEDLSLPPVYNGTPLVFSSQDEINWSAILYDLDGFVYEVYESPVDNSVPVVEPDVTGYEIFNNEGEHRSARGVAADGAAKVDIRLKGTIPLVIADFSWVEEGEEPWEGFKTYDKWFEWSLKEGVGELENTGHCRWVTFKAPEDFPGGPNESEVTVHVVFNYCNADGEKQEPIEIPVVIARAPLVLLHGLNGDERTWSDFKKKVTPPNNK